MDEHRHMTPELGLSEVISLTRRVSFWQHALLTPPIVLTPPLLLLLRPLF